LSVYTIMPKLSKEKQEKIQEQVLLHLFSIFPQQIFTSDIAKEMARDEEFIKTLLLDMEKKELIIKISKNSQGINYLKRARWRLSNKAYDIYSQHQQKSAQVNAAIEKDTTNISENIS